MSWAALLKDGRAMKKAQGRTLGQMAMAANTPTMLKSGLVDGDTEAGVLASGQVAGMSTTCRPARNSSSGSCSAQPKSYRERGSSYLV